MDLGRPEGAAVLLPSAVGAHGVDVREHVRRAHEVEVPAGVLAEVERLLDRQMPTMAAFFGMDLREREGSGFVRYGPGGFYRPHQDWAERSVWPGAARRQVAAVLFLNNALEADPAGDFEGGQLHIYANDPRLPPTVVVPPEGTLVAFPARQWHAVTTVGAGTRDVVVDWYY